LVLLPKNSKKNIVSFDYFIFLKLNKKAHLWQCRRRCRAEKTKEPRVKQRQKIKYFFKILFGLKWKIIQGFIGTVGKFSFLIFTK